MYIRTCRDAEQAPKFCQSHAVPQLVHPIGTDSGKLLNPHSRAHTRLLNHRLPPSTPGTPHKRPPLHTPLHQPPDNNKIVAVKTQGHPKASPRPRNRDDDPAHDNRRNRRPAPNASLTWITSSPAFQISRGSGLKYHVSSTYLPNCHVRMALSEVVPHTLNAGAVPHTLKAGPPDARSRHRFSASPESC